MDLRLVRVSPQDSVQTAIGRMLEESVGSVAVCEGPRIVGIFTERDVLRLAGEQRAAAPRRHDAERADLLALAGCRGGRSRSRR